MTQTITLGCRAEFAFGPYGGAELFFADIDGDGQMEVLAYQGPAVFGAGLYRVWPKVAAAFPQSVCLSAFRKDGTRLWTYGQPNPTDRSYICHAHESCVATGDVNGDGVAEVALADGDRIVLLDGPTGKVRAERRLPEDNYYIVQILGQKVACGEAALVVKNGEGGYGAWRYGEPVLGLGADLATVWGPVAVPGGGHHIIPLDLDNTGAKEFLIGYCLVHPGGQQRCIVPGLDPATVDASSSHVDYTDILQRSGQPPIIGFAGSDKAYLVVHGEGTRFVKPDKHVQGCAVGRFRTDSEWQMAVYNDDGPMVLYDQNGTELWRVPTQERWPLGAPRTCAGHEFHRNRPVVKLTLASRDYLLYTDGGWPWAMDGDGRIAVEFEPPANSRQPETQIPDGTRADDMGYGFGTQIVDWNGDGKPCAVVYDRRHLWMFPATKPA
ncbi:MAG: hypothetical protein A3K19_12060 [Lentisphaerae bacterium RIFOXYB12_FULL_65_16]|nr:MAG: hypothetical protein A3K18_14455 [Lentisphaerae bacterium RIFOXYA12_64_32]OGV86211.1 MAG: hypothetical protein A3K19_12060 [Lentisphaerae bacterium RIFOXYB12_FULL_65_16]